LTSLTSGFIIWNQGSITSPDFVPKEIYPPALQVSELTETVYATYAEAEAAITANGGPHNYHAASAAGGLGSGAIGPIGGAVQTGANDAGSVSAFLAKLGTRSLWTRVAKVGVGVALIITGVVQLTHAQKLAGTAAKAAVLA
jgi:hypothetical protein